MTTKAVKKKPPALKIKVGQDALAKAVHEVAAEKQQGFLHAIDNPPAHIVAEFGPGLIKEVQKKAHEMFPGDGSVKVQSTALETVTNPATNSKFVVVGKRKDGLRVSIRFWPAAATEKGHTTVKFRVRVGDQDPIGASDFQYIDNVLAHMKTEFPDLIPSMSATAFKTEGGVTTYPHVSFEGAVDFNCPAWDHGRISKMLADEPFIEELWYAILKLAQGNFTMTRPQFGQWVEVAITDLLKAATEPEPPANKMKYKLGNAGARLITSDKTKMTKKEALQASGAF
jgi:hypothetical protein